MRNIAITIAMALGGLAAYAANEPATADNSTDQAIPTAKCSTCPEGLQCDGTAWVDLETITVEAANGDPIAQYAIAYITDNGLGDTPKDPDKAQELYKHALPGLQRAAEKGHPIACRALARMYAEGKGVDKDEAKAAEHMKHCVKCCKDMWKHSCRRMHEGKPMPKGECPCPCCKSAKAESPAS